MKKLIDLLTCELEQAFEKAGYDKKYAKVTLSNRPDLCEYQCNGAMAAVKEYRKAPIMIANDVVAALEGNACVEKVEAVNPGFINIILNPEFVVTYLKDMEQCEKLGVEEPQNPKTIVVDYGGANVAKALHVGHLRPAIIGESVKRIGRYVGHKVIGDVHLGDWGSQMGLVMMELKKRQPELPYFDDNFEGEYPEESPFTIEELGEIYPTASAYAKEHEDFKEEALKATYLLQNGHRGYTALR
jgi:arginyl-tRNA synthetase